LQAGGAVTVTVATIAVQEPTFTIAEVAERTGVSAHTLRYYERIGLLDVGRHASGHRRFSGRDVDRVVFIGRLRATAMPIPDIQRYFALVAPRPLDRGRPLGAAGGPSRCRPRPPAGTGVRPGRHRAQDRPVRRVLRALTPGASTLPMRGSGAGRPSRRLRPGRVTP